jgi:hypothetical protein
VVPIGEFGCGWPGGGGHVLVTMAVCQAAASASSPSSARM